jgi:hypothetical protein
MYSLCSTIVCKKGKSNGVSIGILYERMMKPTHSNLTQHSTLQQIKSLFPKKRKLLISLRLRVVVLNARVESKQQQRWCLKETTDADDMVLGNGAQFEFLKAVRLQK